MNKIIDKIFGCLKLTPFIILGFLAVTACQKSTEESQTTLEGIRSKGVIKIGYANEAPYAYYNSGAGRLTGEAPEIAREIAKRMGAQRVEGVLTEFSSLIPGLKAKRFDIIAAGMYILPKRCREVAFTNPTYKVGEAFLVKKGNPLDLHSYEDIPRHDGAKLGVVAGTVELGYARAAGIPSERIALLPDVPSAVDAVKAGRIDAYGGTSLTINDIMSKTADRAIERAEPFTNPVIEDKQVVGYGAFALRKEDGDLLDEFNKHLADFIGSDTHRKAVETFGFNKSELPGDITAEELCKGA